MKKLTLMLALLVLITLLSCAKGRSEKEAYKTVAGDPLNGRIYTLENGMKVFLTVQKDAPRIQTMLSVNVGSKNDPATNTGLAHYLEHLLFKGTDKIGTTDYAQEKVSLDSITDLFTQYHTEKDSARRKELYAHIDSLSYDASQYSIAGEYNKILTSLGAKGTNAYTDKDLTCYINDIPANQVKKWLMVEAERFRNPVFRLFHTELEVVYEEKNRGLDSDRRKAWVALSSVLWPTHPYGTQSTLGTIEHLKSPSIQAVYDFYHKWYVPNNMALSLSGDFNPDEMIQLVKETFGLLPSKKIERDVFAPEKPLLKPIEVEVIGPDLEGVLIGYRLPTGDMKEVILFELTSQILMNGVAGIMDLNLNQTQKVIDPWTWRDIKNENLVQYLGGRPREGQTLEDVKHLLIAQIDSLKAGHFPDWLPEAAANNLSFNDAWSYENNYSRAYSFIWAFTNGFSWEDHTQKWDIRNALTKKDVVEFANRSFKNNYAVVYKRNGVDSTVQKIVKPSISPVELNRGKQSEFVMSLDSIKAGSIDPQFLDFKNDIQHGTLDNGIEVLYKQNTKNKRYELTYLFDFGRRENRYLEIAFDYLQFLGTSQYSPNEFKQEMYKLGGSYGAWSNEKHAGIFIRGLDGQFAERLTLLEALLNDVQPNREAFKSLIENVIKKRSDEKFNKEIIMGEGMWNYAMYGKDSYFRNRLSIQELQSLSPELLINELRNITQFTHRAVYYGPATQSAITANLNKNHLVSKELFPTPKQFKKSQLSSETPAVYVCNYPMKQAEIMLYAKGAPFSNKNLAVQTLFNQYYGGSMASVVFQTLRESQALAYTVWAYYGTPFVPYDSHFIKTYIGTQADKTIQAVDGMFALLHKMPKTEVAFNEAKQALLEKMQTERIMNESVLWHYVDEEILNRNDEDIRKAVYAEVMQLTFDDMQHFFDTYIKNKKYTMLVLGDVSQLPLKALEKYGTVSQLSLEEVFGY